MVDFLFLRTVPVLAFAAAMACLGACDGEGLNQTLDWRYSTAWKASQKDGKPLLVLVSAKWCDPCRRVKRDVLPTLDLKSVNFAIVDVDDSPGLAGKLQRGDSRIPRFIAYYKDDTGVGRRKVCKDAPHNVQGFIDKLSKPKQD